jgi:hypothetical protein
VDREDVLVDEVALHQRLDQLSASEDHEILARLFLQPCHGARGVALEKRGVAPRERLLQGGRRHVLLAAVDHRGVGVVLRLLGPDGGEVLVGPSLEQQRPALGDAFCHHAAHDRIGVGRRPAAVLEAVAAVLVGVAGCLHHAIERQVVGHDDLAHGSSPDVEESDVALRQRSPLVTAGNVPASHPLNERLPIGSTAGDRSHHQITRSENVSPRSSRRGAPRSLPPGRTDERLWMRRIMAT